MSRTLNPSRKVTQLLLQMKGYNAYSLREGISAWWDQVITPTSLGSESADPAGYQQARQLREYFFGGGGAPAKGTAATPAVNAPILPPETQPGAKPEQKKLKLGKGCS